MSAALALPGPFDFTSPPRGGLIGGGTRLAPTQAEVIQFLTDLVKNNVTNPFPTPPPFVGTAAAAGATLVAAELLFPPSAGEPGLWDPASGLDPYGNPLDPQAPGAANGDRGQNADPPTINGNFDYDQGLTGIYKVRYSVIRNFGATFICGSNAQKGDYEYTESDSTSNFEGKRLVSRTSAATATYVCSGGSGIQFNAPIWTVEVDGVSQVIARANKGEGQAGNPKYYSVQPHFNTEVKVRSVTFNDTDITDYDFKTQPAPIATPPVTSGKTAVATAVPAPKAANWWYGGPRVATAQGTQANQPATATGRLLATGVLSTSPAARTVRQLWTDPVTNPSSPRVYPTIKPIGPPTAQPAQLKGVKGLPPMQPLTPGRNQRTPTNMHFPVRGLNGVTPGGARLNIGYIAREVGRIEQKVASNMQYLPLILQALETFFEILGDGNLPAVEYQLTGVCEENNSDNVQPSQKWLIPESDVFVGLEKRIDAVSRMLQVHLGYKTPTCGTPQTERPVLEGDWRTISFRSDDVSPYGKSRLRKRFRYRSVSSLGLGDVVAHWMDFTFEAGSVCVQHAGASWGTPQVWAATADEGKRVIRHAAGEAGLDPDQDGRWIVGGSRSARIGVSGTMRVDTKGGYYWITARDGSDQRPIVALT